MSTDGDNSVSPQANGRMADALIRLFFTQGLPCFLILVLSPYGTSQIWLFEALALLSTLASAYWAGRCYSNPFFFQVCGMFGGMNAGLVLLSDPRGGLSPGWTGLWHALGPYCMFVLVTGVACRLLARKARQHQLASDARRTEMAARCERCGYLLYGLPENRCPECGEEFSAEMRRSVPSDMVRS